jgi:asparagine synthase (glutamine-hydrolysing)
MCGICGIYGLEDKALIYKMLSVIRHRGPDDQGIFTSDAVSIGHARLSIIDLSEKGRQPMFNEDKTIVMAVNGEIYNFVELRNFLQNKGHRFYSHSDSEIIIHAYEEFGLDFVKKFNGMFAFVLYDTIKKIFILGRDPIGEKPLYYCYDGKQLIFASEIKAILEAGIKREIDYEALWSFLEYNYVLGEKTLFKNIFKLLPGTILVVKDGQLQKSQYWNISEHIIHASESFFEKKLRTLLEDSIEKKMVADVPVGAFLSGGIDSSAVVALARKYTDTFHTFSVGFETFSELEYAKVVSDYFDTVHHEILITDKLIKNYLPKIAWYNDEPLSELANANIFFLSQEAKKHVTVTLAGEGGDELFAGYETYQANMRISKFYTFKFNKLLKKLRSISPMIFSKFSSHIPLVSLYSPALTQDDFEKFHQFTLRTFHEQEVREMFDIPYFDTNSALNYPKDMKTAIGKLLAMDCKNNLPEKFLMKADRGTMANAVEGRLPLLDKNIIEFAFCIPARMKIRQGVSKYIFRKSVHDLLPKSIINRPKQGFGTPIQDWFNGELKEIIVQKVSDGELITRLAKQKPVYAPDNIASAIRKTPQKIWNLTALELWYELFIKNTPVGHLL